MLCERTIQEAQEARGHLRLGEPGGTGEQREGLAQGRQKMHRRKPKIPLEFSVTDPTDRADLDPTDWADLAPDPTGWADLFRRAEPHEQNCY